MKTCFYRDKSNKKNQGYIYRDKIFILRVKLKFNALNANAINLYRF